MVLAGQPTGPSTFCSTSEQSFDILGGIRDWVRGSEVTNSAHYGAPVWPYGLAFDLVVAGVLLYGAVRRLQTPRRHLPKGVRLA